jgi:hypothetical protein
MRALLIGYLQQAARGKKAHRPVVYGKVGLQPFGILLIPAQSELQAGRILAGGKQRATTHQMG